MPRSASCATHGRLQVLRVRRADAVVDVDAVRLGADRDDVRAELVEHRRRDVVAGAVRAVDDDAPALEVELGRETCSCRTRCSGPPASSMRRALPSCADGTHASGSSITLSIACSTLVGKLRARAGEELDPVVVERIVRRADHDAGGQAQRARQVRDRRRRQRARTDRRRRRRRTAPPRARLPADSRRCACPCRSARAGRTPSRARVGGEHAARGPAELQHELGRDRRLADASAHAVGAEVLSRHRADSHASLFDSARSSRSTARPHLQRVDRLAHVVHAHDRRAARDRRQRGREARGQPLVDARAR